MQVYHKNGTLFVVKGNKNFQINKDSFKTNYVGPYLTSDDWSWEDYDLLVDLPDHSVGDSDFVQNLVLREGLVVKTVGDRVVEYYRGEWRGFGGDSVSLSNEEVVKILDM